MKKLNKHDKIVVNLAIKETLKLTTKEKDFVQFKVGRKVFKIIRIK